MLLNDNKHVVCLASDTHEEHDWGTDTFKSKLPKENTIDVFVAAGDMGSSTHIAEMLINEYCYIPIIYVSGNHEYYWLDKKSVNQKFHELAKKHDNFIFLEDGQKFHYEGIDYIGGTNWSSIPESVQLECKLHIADYSYIAEHYVTDTSLKQTFDKNLKKSLEQSKYKRVGISHFLPSWECVSDYYRQPRFADLNHYFVSEVDSDTLDKFDYWFFGHSHTRMDKVIGNCRFIANPRGYPSENKKEWKPKIITINT